MHYDKVAQTIILVCVVCLFYLSNELQEKAVTHEEKLFAERDNECVYRLSSTSQVLFVNCFTLKFVQ